MNARLFRRNLGHHAMLMVAIGAGLFLFEVLLVWVVAQIDTGAGLLAVLSPLVPPDMQGILFEQFGVATFPGAVAFGFRHPFTMVSAVALVVVAATVPAAERESGFLDLVLARPVPRSTYLAASAGLMLACVLLAATAVVAGAAVGIRVAGRSDVVWTSYLSSGVVLALLLLAVGGYTLLLATDSPRRGQAVARAVGLTLLFYLLDFLGGLWDLLEVARWLSPFSYFDPAGAALGAGLQWRDPVVLITVAAVTLVGAFLNFRRQEL